MFSPPRNVSGECNARLYIRDDFDKNKCTMRCRMLPGHEGKHEEIWRQGQCKIEWVGDDFREQQIQHRNDLHTRIADFFKAMPEYNRLVWDGKEVAAYKDGVAHYRSAFTKDSHTDDAFENIYWCLDLDHDPKFDTKGIDHPSLPMVP